VVHFAAELLVYFVPEWQSLKINQKTNLTLNNPYRLVYFAPESVVHIGAE